MLGEASLEIDFSPPPTNDTTLLPTHCRVLSSEALRNTDTVLSILTIEGGMLRQSLNFTCTGNESSSTDTVQLVVTGESRWINYSLTIIPSPQMSLTLRGTPGLLSTL